MRGVLWGWMSDSTVVWANVTGKSYLKKFIWRKNATLLLKKMKMKVLEK
jgi:hypothetical protein